MTRRKSWRPPKLAAKPKAGKSKMPKAPPPLKPAQAKLDGFTTAEFEEIEAASERFAIVQDRIKAKKKTLQAELDKEEGLLKEVMKKYDRDSIEIGGYTVQIVTTQKAKVKGLPPPKDETASRDYTEKEDEEKDHEEKVKDDAERFGLPAGEPSHATEAEGAVH